MGYSDLSVKRITGHEDEKLSLARSELSLESCYRDGVHKTESM